jgi:ParB family chromosome partitioning protein
MSKALKRPQLKNIDALFNISDTGTTGKLVVEELEIKSLVPFDGHPFYLYEDERLEDMTESIKMNGVLVPILVRKKDSCYEILAGHNRVNCSEIAGKTTVPAIVLGGISDEEALSYVIETNLMQRSFADMKHSEKAAVIAMHHAKMFSPGKRHDILRILEQMENPNKKLDENPDNINNNAENSTLPQVGEKSEEKLSHTDKKIAEMYSLSKNTVSRYLRINQLYTPLKEMLDIGYVPFIPAVTISFLSNKEQIMLADYLDEGIGKKKKKKAELMREFSKENKLDRKCMVEILKGQAVQKKQTAPAIKVSNDVYDRYFSSGQSEKEIQNIVEEALTLYFERQAV